VNRLALQLSERDVLTASMTRDQAIEYASAMQTLKPFNLSLTAVAEAVKECFASVGGLADLQAADRRAGQRIAPCRPTHVHSLPPANTKAQRRPGSEQRRGRENLKSPL
jgi:hypothetical protein